MNHSRTQGHDSDTTHRAVATLREINELPLGKAARVYVGEFAIPVFPVRPRAKDPLVEGGLYAATTDLAQVETWWGRWPDANIALRTGAASGYVVLDGDDDEGIGNAQSLVGDNEVLHSNTGGGGRHYFYAHPGPNRYVPNDSIGKLASRVHVRGDGGYVLLPPSITEGVYQWAI